MNKKSLSLTVGWLYPDLMSTYGDRGNILVLQKRCQWRDINITILPVDQSTRDEEIRKVDLIFGGGSQDKEQALVMENLKGEKGKIIKEKIENGISALFVCGAPQLMGKYYEPSVGARIEGLGIFDMVTKHPGPSSKRLIGNVVAEVLWDNLAMIAGQPFEKVNQNLHPSENDNKKYIVGFENHGGRTYLGENAKPFAKVVKGFGNNGTDCTEGVVYKNAVGCYFHGPLLPKNPQIADFFIQRSLEVKYKEKIDLKSLDDTLEIQAQKAIAKKLGVAL